MELDKLDRAFHEKTRFLWEAVFEEDTREFLDYYYTDKTCDNDIYVMKEDQEIRSMLHLNPYQVSVNGIVSKVNYIVAVATDSQYRKRGYMAALLKRSMNDMYAEGQPFTFLMPAAEAIYLPFDFRYVYDQHQEQMTALMAGITERITIREAEEADCEQLGIFAERFLQASYQVYARRDEQYYRRMLHETKSQNGGIMLAEDAEGLKGFLIFVKGEAVEVMEPLFEPADRELLCCCIGKAAAVEERIKVSAWNEGSLKPMIMARIIHLEHFLTLLRANDSISCCLTIQDPLISANNKTIRIDSNGNGESLRVTETLTKESGGTVEIADLVSVMFGYKEAEILSLSAELTAELKKIIPLRHVFLNEIV